MIFLAISAVVIAMINLHLAMIRTTLEDRVDDLIRVVLVDAILLVLYEILIGDPAMVIFMVSKYLFLSFVDFNKTLRAGL